MTITLQPHTPHKAQLFSSGLIAGPDLKPVMSWGKSSFGTGKKTLHVEGAPVFRSGTFRDSMGIQTTWEDVHIEQMEFNFNHLVNTKVLEQVPVRKGHGSFFGDPMETLIGWHSGLSVEQHQSPVDGATYAYLLANYEIFDAEAAEHVFEGHWPNRSAEVGYFITNSEAEFWPVYQGFAFVDIPAVEGLNAFSKAINPDTNKVSIFMEGSTVTQPADTEPQGAGDSTPTPSPSPTPPSPSPSPSPSPTPTPTSQEGGSGDSEPDPADQPTEPGPPPTEPSPAAGDTGDHSKQSGVHSFKIGGKDVTDPAAVQAYINSVETAALEEQKANRANFVSALAEQGKIAAPQVDDLTEFAQGLSAEQYAKWSASYGSVPSSSLFGNHGADQGDNGGVPAGTNGKYSKDDIEAAKVIVSMHRQRNTPEETIKQYNSYKILADALPDEYPL